MREHRLDNNQNLPNESFPFLINHPNTRKTITGVVSILAPLTFICSIAVPMKINSTESDFPAIALMIFFLVLFYLNLRLATQFLKYEFDLDEAKDIISGIEDNNLAIFEKESVHAFEAEANDDIEATAGLSLGEP